MAKELRMIAIANIRCDQTQTRAGMDRERIDEYAERLEAGDDFPPPVVFHDGDVYRLGDGFHRVEAHRKNGRSRVECEVRRGGAFEAIVHGAGANTMHGLHRSNEDKRQSVRVLFKALADKGESWSDRKIAETCGVHPTFVGNIRKELSTVDSSAPRTGSDGKKRKAPKLPAIASEPPNVYMEIERAMDAATTRAEADSAYSSLSRAASGGGVSAREAEELTAKYKETIARLDSADDEESDVEPQVFDGDDPPPRQDEPKQEWGSFDVSQRVVRIASACRESEERIGALYADLDPRFAADVRRRAQDSVLRLVMALDALLPPDGTRAESNRAKFGVVTGGKGT